MRSEKKSYYAIIPADVRYDKRLKPNAKLLYGEITALCNEKGYCWANNQYFANLYEVNTKTISRWISQLADLKYIKIELSQESGNTRKIKLSRSHRGKGVVIKKSRGSDEKVTHNNTINNSGFENKKIRKLTAKQAQLTADVANIERYLRKKNA